MVHIIKFDWTDRSGGPSIAFSPQIDGERGATHMRPTSVPTRITIDFRDAVHPSRSWILGLDDDAERVELLAFEERPAPNLGWRHTMPTTEPAELGDEDA
jgi:hypothetical protein